MILAGIDVIGCDIAQSFVITPVVIIFVLSFHVGKNLCLKLIYPSDFYYRASDSGDL